MNDPLIRYELVKAQQRERWQKGELARQARAATPGQPGRVERMEPTPDLTGLIERVIQHVWKRLGLPAREPGARPEEGRSGLPSGEMKPAHLADTPLFDLH